MTLNYFDVDYDTFKERIPYYDIRGAQGDGPTVVVTGGVHGNEINGVALVKAFVEKVEREQLAQKLKGRLLVFPVINTSGFRSRTRRVFHDGLDLNRQFGFEVIDTFSKHLAKELTLKFFKDANLLVDCHDAGSGAILVPHSRIHIDDEDDCISCSRNVSKIFGTKVVLERLGHKNMMAVALNRDYETPVLTVEIGGSQIIHPQLYKIGLQGLENVLVANRMMEGTYELPKTQYVLSERLGFKAEYTGMVTFDVKLGEVVKKGQEIGELYNPLTQVTQKIISEHNGVIFALWKDNMVPKGRRMYNILDMDDHSVDVLEVQRNG